MLYFKLYDNEKLKSFNHNTKIEIVNTAVKLYRKDKPINIPNRLLSLLVGVGIPSTIMFLAFDFGFALGWFALSGFILNIKLANDESPDIEPYLNQVL